MTAVLPLDPASYRPHALHDPERIWPETNCYVDLWIEVAASLGLEPRAMLGFTLTQDFEGDQFTFFKVPLEDLESLWDLKVQELAIFDRVEAHVATQLERGRLVLVEVDSHYLPDTRGVSYRLTHGKTTIAINRLDPAARQLDYFHNGGFFRLEAEDFDGLFGLLPGQARADRLFPYCEFVKAPAAFDATGVKVTARELLRRHLARRPATNPIRAYGAEFGAHMADLATRSPDYFHTYAFNTLRQLGANFELLAAHLDWLGDPGLEEAREAALAIASGAKTMQFQLARAMARKKFDALEGALAGLADAHDRVMQALDGAFGARAAA
ncbi:MAG: DUF1839 family protein [Hyphomicrobiaceae bacterium]|nr:DUF1839 family protein [Hyphomicrobiaceae bacterium]